VAQKVFARVAIWRGLEARRPLDGVQAAATRDLEASTGVIVDTVRQVADALSLVGESLDAGRVIIAVSWWRRSSSRPSIASCGSSWHR
jgi:hypothetical protein